MHCSGMCEENKSFEVRISYYTLSYCPVFTVRSVRQIKEKVGEAEEVVVMMCDKMGSKIGDLRFWRLVMYLICTAILPSELWLAIH
jgi:hypothetical protein